ncbi:hypothetical protein PR048_023919 [Dryococelus australis]|uniref:Uncharacterized protein n=1 Tax=Dryococelus australis TaxID=614101 RepID=A0ABQ9GVF8_9NEOP|nr:hypothetical protein PR048_023919 [Dryococelus australis]
MADEETLLLSGSAEKQLNNGCRRKIRLSEWKDNNNKALRNAGKPYRNRKGTFYQGHSEGNSSLFGPPLSDSCSYCDELYIHLVAAETEDEQKRISVQSKLHQRKSETAYKVLHKDVIMSKSNPTYAVLCIDMQQKYFSTIDQKFLVSGHSFLSCDRDFALIESTKKKSTVYHPKQWLEVIVNGSPAFSAYYTDREDFIDLFAIDGMFKKQPDFKITYFHWIQFSSEEPNTVRTRVNHNILQPWHSYVIRPFLRGRKHLRPLPTVLPQLYEEAKALKKVKKKKKKNLLDMCRFLPVQYRHFYANLCAFE